MRKFQKRTGLNLQPGQTLSTSDLLNYRGGIGDWDGRCGFHNESGWHCGDASDANGGFTHDDVQDYYAGTDSVDLGNVTGWCCASCADSGKCGPALVQ